MKGFETNGVKTKNALTGESRKKVMRKHLHVSMIETAAKDQSTEWEFPVAQEELVTSKGVASGIHAVIRGDTGQVIGSYRGQKVLPYSQLVETFETVLNDAQIPFQRQLLTTQNGGRFFGKYDLGNGLAVKEESFKSILRLQSSHDGTLTPGFGFEAERLVCLNGMMIMAEVFAMFKKHSEKLDLGFIELNVTKAIEAGQGHLTKTVKSMSEIGISDKQARNVLSNIVSKGKCAGVSPRTGFLVYHNWQTPTEDEKQLGDTLYRLYNSAMRFTRDVDKVGRFELSRRANLYLTGTFDLASRQTHAMKALLDTPSEPLEFDAVTVN